MIITHTIMILVSVTAFKNVMMLFNVNFCLQLILFVVFLIIEQEIQK